MRTYLDTWERKRYSLGLPKNQSAPVRRNERGGRSSLRFQGRNIEGETRSDQWHLKLTFYRCRGAAEPPLTHGY